AHAISQQLLNSGIQLGFLRFQGGFRVSVGFLGLQFGDVFFGGFQRSAVGFELGFQSVDLVERLRNILLQLCFLSSFCFIFGSKILLGGLGFALAFFGSGHGIFLLICSGFYKENVA